MAHRKAASVLPVPVGAAMSVCLPAAIAGQPCRCGAVGSPSVSRNHAATVGRNPGKPSRSSPSTGADIAGSVLVSPRGPCEYTAPLTPRETDDEDLDADRPDRPAARLDGGGGRRRDRRPGGADADRRQLGQG